MLSMKNQATPSRRACLSLARTESCRWCLGRPSRLVYVRSFQDTNIWRVETSASGAPASTPPVISISSTRRDSTPHLSPNGRRMAFVSDRSGRWEIWLADPDGSNAVQLTSTGADSGARGPPSGREDYTRQYRTHWGGKATTPGGYHPGRC